MFFCLKNPETFGPRNNIYSRSDVQECKNAKELQKENTRLKKLLSEVQRKAATSQAALDESRAQHAAVAEQFTQTLAEKDQLVALRWTPTGQIDAPRRALTTIEFPGGIRIQVEVPTQPQLDNESEDRS